ncbi:MAG: T9SS type A sorting domain-containing protein [Bacteroidales bacterium]|nr:T9SS type A sorting domain-containing protein [Bacteroidales bacterium]
MKKVFVLSLFVVFAVYAKIGFSQSISKKMATQAASKMLSTKAPSKTFSLENFSAIPVKGTSIDNPEVYILNYNQGGFVIISGDKSATPVIGYSTEGKIPTEKWNPNFAEWIQNSINQIKFYRSSKSISTQEIENQWSFLLGESNINPYPSQKGVAPLLRSAWGQGGHYNAMCPTIDGVRTYVGCVATSMAQIMYYYRYPKAGYGAHSYVSNCCGTLTVNYNAAKYNYEEMISNVYCPMPEVAKLSYHCGVAVNMNYGTESSGSFSSLVPEALKTHFRFASANFMKKADYSNSGWETLLKNNLNAKRPVYYSGSGEENGGHAFLLDGFDDSNYFHFDWGWNGQGNGYFALTALNPEGYSFTDGQQCVESIYPPTSMYPYGCPTDTMKLTRWVGSVEDGSGYMNNYAPNRNGIWLIQPKYPGEKFNISFKEFDLGLNDTLYFYVVTDSSLILKNSFGGDSLPENFEIEGKKLLVKFISDGIYEGNGFLFEYNMGPYPASCSGITTLTNERDTIDDGSGDAPYGNSSVCKWNIQPPGATGIGIEFLKFDLADADDYVKITDAVNSTVLGEFRNGDNPTTIYANTSKITVTFKTDSYDVADGFEFVYWVSNSIEEIEKNSKFDVYPNPAKNFINIIPNKDINNGTIVIYDFSGKCVYKTSFTNEKIIIPIDNLTSGIYQIGLISEKENSWQKIVIE